ncbi:extensin-like isoform X2 [Portunus trituberculatus]|nr:extensin-like isoform X2 [Portunus trituberculatus]XP_045108944.1 extensin-like isoform X2 [Portunus trituberculatus]XP_045108946.1 extensin-like isoform X2 [Portunus trituberculatus]
MSVPMPAYARSTHPTVDEFEDDMDAVALDLSQFELRAPPRRSSRHWSPSPSPSPPPLPSSQGGKRQPLPMNWLLRPEGAPNGQPPPPPSQAYSSAMERQFTRESFAAPPSDYPAPPPTNFHPHPQRGYSLPPPRNYSPPPPSDYFPHPQRGYSPSPPDDYPPSVHDYPPHPNDYPPHPNGYPPHPNGYPPHPNDYPPHPNDYPLHPNDYPPHPNGYPPHPNDYPPHPDEYPAPQRGHLAPPPRGYADHLPNDYYPALNDYPPPLGDYPPQTWSYTAAPPWSTPVKLLPRREVTSKHSPPTEATLPSTGTTLRRHHPQRLYEGVLPLDLSTPHPRDAEDAPSLAPRLPSAEGSLLSREGTLATPDTPSSALPHSLISKKIDFKISTSFPLPPTPLPHQILSKKIPRATPPFPLPPTPLPHQILSKKISRATPPFPLSPTPLPHQVLSQKIFPTASPLLSLTGAQKVPAEETRDSEEQQHKGQRGKQGHE